jgi:hypothetical protein
MAVRGIGILPMIGRSSMTTVLAGGAVRIELRLDHRQDADATTLCHERSRRGIMRDTR